MSKADPQADFTSEKWITGPGAVLTQCALCSRYVPGRVAVCAAFPGGIPAEILENRADHREPWIDPETLEPGDTGVDGKASILFDPDPETGASALDALYRHLDGLGIN